MAAKPQAKASTEVAQLAFRLGVASALLHPDVQAAVRAPGIIVETLGNSCEALYDRLSALGLSSDDFDGLGVAPYRPTK